MKKQIEFDFAKWGQEGISVAVNGCKIATLHKHTSIPDCYYGHYEKSINTFSLYGNNFTMFQEVKPREFWINLYSNGCKSIHSCTEEANELAKNVQINHTHLTIETIKVREVLD